MFEKDDKIIRFTKYGSVNISIVKDVTYTYVIDGYNRVMYEKWSIITDKNILLELDGSDGQIYKVTKEYTNEEHQKMLKLYEYLNKAKNDNICKSRIV